METNPPLLGLPRSGAALSRLRQMKAHLTQRLREGVLGGHDKRTADAECNYPEVGISFTSSFNDIGRTTAIMI